MFCCPVCEDKIPSGLIEVMFKGCEPCNVNLYGSLLKLFSSDLSLHLK
ncbi:hypothetical protein J4459_02455 [Candidatus Woesearchaeota archaeon]|nr:hypothetical protein [Candidatus Woesearchaeota archaeon]